jgi:ATP/ADP translocase
MEEYSNETFILDLTFLKEIAERVSNFKNWILSLFFGLLLGIVGNFIVTLIGDTWIVSSSIETRGYLTLICVLIILILLGCIFLFFLFINKIFPNFNLNEINLDLWYARTKQIKPDRQYISKKYIFPGLR